jgi:hypothetical protein
MFPFVYFDIVVSSFRTLQGLDSVSVVNALTLDMVVVITEVTLLEV